jgi:putative nucleotidyltransferase-like protein
VLYLCIHATHHEWPMLKWLVDVHQTVLSEVLNWQKMTEKAERLELSLVMRQTLAVISFLWEQSCRETVLRPTCLSVCGSSRPRLFLMNRRKPPRLSVICGC